MPCPLPKLHLSTGSQNTAGAKEQGDRFLRDMQPQISQDKRCADHQWLIARTPCPHVTLAIRSLTTLAPILRHFGFQVLEQLPEDI